MKKIFFIFYFFIFLFSFASAQDVFNYPLNPQTEAVFTATCLRLSQYSFIRGDFEQEKIISRHRRSLKSSGKFLIARDLGMMWETLKPFPSTLTLGRDFLVQSRPGGQRTVVNAQGNETFLGMSDLLSSVFSGNARLLMDNFKIFYTSSASSWELGLLPLGSAVNSFAQMIIIKGDAVIKSIQIFEQSGDSIKYDLSNHSFPSELSANENALFSVQ